MPRCFSMSIQSDTAWRALCLPLTEPAVWMAPPYKSSFSVRVVLPASGCEMIANVRRLSISSRMVGMGLILSLLSGCGRAAGPCPALRRPQNALYHLVWTEL